MKKILRFLARVLNVFYKVLPFFLGTYFYYPFYASESSHEYPLLDAMYSAIRLYYGESEDGIEANFILQLARFLAIAATVSILITAFNKVNSVANRLKLIFPDSTVIYGDSVYADILYDNISMTRRIHGDPDKVIKNASRYMIMFSSDIENIRFYNRNYEYLKDKDTYIMLDDVSKQNIENHHVKVFSMAENCAIQYWRDFPVENNEKIAIIGFGNLGENILLNGLQVNIITLDQHFEYHIFGDGSYFRREHTELDKMAPDEIIFHDDGKYDYSEMSSFDRIIICKDNDGSNVVKLSKLLEYSPVNCKIHVYAPNEDIITNLFNSENITCFGNARDLASMDMILNERIMEAARKQNEDYLKIHEGEPWEKLDNFRRYSNLSSSQYAYTIRRLIDKDIPVKTLAELEHIRWCRYHYIYNWKYGDETDKKNHIHHSLVPFSELGEEDKNKDIESLISKFPELKERIKEETDLQTQ